MGDICFMTSSTGGYTGSYSNLERLLATWRRAERPEADKEKNDAAPARLGLADSRYHDAPVCDPHTGHLISPIDAATLCIKPRGALKQGSQTFALCVASRCDFAEYFIAESRQDSKIGLMKPFILASFPWPVLPASSTNSRNSGSHWSRYWLRCADGAKGFRRCTALSATRVIANLGLRRLWLVILMAGPRLQMRRSLRQGHNSILVAVSSPSRRHRVQN